ncbi:lantibiotic dehydratase [Micromonospora sp. KC207]|uniref:lantibiotic dehydratase n=1 Tax=Micromonospora sp. KC207 TaxID=2530377 RepID=UPI001A9E2106|nr:lantibiotic dehydratase [Micromonospora sp. KC207]
MAFREYVLWRRGTVSVEALHALRASRTWAALAEVDVAEAALADAAERVSAALFSRVPELGARERGLVLRVRRRLHNDRPSATDLAAARAVLDEPGRSLLAQWGSLREARDAHLAEAEGALAEELMAARLALAKQLDGDLLDGILLSGRTLLESVTAYRDAVAASGGAAPGKRLRTAEKTALAYLTRSACKPTPFGRFTEVGAQPWTAGPGEPGVVSRRARLNRGLLTWMASEVVDLPGMDEVVQVRLNSTLRVSGDRVEFFQRGRDGRADGLRGERFGAVPLSAALRLVMEVLAEGARSKAELVAVLAARSGQPVAGVERFVAKLVKAGVCHTDLGVPDQEPTPAGRMAEVLHRSADPRAAGLAALFERLQRAEDEFPGAALPRRIALLAQLDGLRREFVAQAEVAPEVAGQTSDRALVFEDTGRSGPAAGWNPAALESVADEFAVLGGLLPLVDDSTLVRLGLYAHFTATRGGPTPILDYYRDVVALGAQGISSVMTAQGDPAAETVRQRRAQLVARLAELATAPGEVVDLDLDWARRFVGSLPGSLGVDGGFAARVQLADGTVVLNSVMSGQGVFYSRFCDLLPPEPNGWSLAGAVRAAIEPRQMDLTAVLGLNIAVHPPLAPLELRYPRVVSPGAAHTLAELTVEADHATRRLVLRSTRDGRIVQLTPMSFLFPAAGPMLYRFLCAFAPIVGARRGWWHRLPADVPRVPRLTLGGLVLDRRAWRLPAGPLDLPTTAETVAELRAVRRWQRDLGIDDECFFTVREAPAPDAGDWVAQTRRWARQARQARLSKRHYLHFGSPLLLNVFLRQLPREADGSVVVLEEALPAPASAPRPATGGAEEYVIEYVAG